MRATVPPRLADLPVDLSAADARATERAIAAVARVRDRLPESWEPLARLLLRSEGVASSAVEQIRAPLAEVAAAELTPLSGPSAWVADNLAVVSDAVSAPRTGPLTVAAILAWHTRLMAHVAGGDPASPIGAWRDGLVWVGGNSPLDAAFVGPPAGLVGDLMDDLVRFANDDALDPVTHAAILHAQ
ncbi:MAG: Fic family protein, partial [Acidimicrobiales bacterium]